MTLDTLSDQARQMLMLFDRHSDSPAVGARRRFLEFHFRAAHGGSDPDPGSVARELEQAGLVAAADGGARWILTETGYAALLAAPASAELGGRLPVEDSEYALRNAVLDIFREFEVEVGDGLAAPLLRSFWISAGRRAVELRLTLDLLMRDRYLRLGRFDRTQFLLQPDGRRYLDGRSPPDGLLALAPRLNPDDRYIHSVPDDSLMVLAAQVFRGQQALPPGSLSPGELLHGLSVLDVPEFQHFHACDLMYRYECMELVDPARLGFSLTERGMRLVEDAATEVVQWTARIAINDAQRGPGGDAGG